MIQDFLQDDSIQNRPLKAIYEFIYHHGPVSQAEIIEKTKLNRTKAARLIAELMEKGYVKEYGYGESTGGRPPVLYQIDPTCSYIIGVRITRTVVNVVLFDLYFNQLNQNSFVMTTYHTPEVVLSEIKKTIASFMKIHSLSVGELLGIGIGSIGLLDRNKGIIINTEFLAPGWVHVPIVEKLQDTFPVKILLEVYSTAAVLGVKRYLEVPFRNLLYVVNAWIMGCGILTDGHLIQIKSGDVSTYGHMIVDANGRTCTCGKRGCVVSYTSLHAILDEIKDNNPILYSQHRENASSASIDDVMNFLLIDDPIIEKAVMRSAYYLGIGVANMVNLLHSELVVLTGPLVDYYPNYYQKAVESAMQHVYKKENVKFHKEGFNKRSGEIGVAVQVLDSMLKI